MRKYLLIMVFIMMVFCLSAVARQGINNQNRPLFAPDLIKIKLSVDAIQRAQLPLGLYAERNDFGINELDQLMAVNGGKAIIRAHREVNDKAWQEQTGFDRWFLIRLDGSVQVKEAIESFKNNRFVEIAIPEYYAYTTAVPNDTYYANNWGHNNTAQLPGYSGSSHSGLGVGTVGYDADMQLAWDQSQGYGSASIIIAIIDTGVDTAHPDLRLVAGYDYGVGDSNPMDDSADPGHGTSCSGVAAAIANNGLGITGAAGGCSVMPLKIAAADGTLGFTAIENALTHTGDHNVDVASMSFGAESGMAEGDSPSTDAALEYAYSHGVTLLAATANSNTSAIAYPSNHNKVISVGASSPTGQRKSDTSSDGEYWWGSNYGTAVQDAQLAVDVCAPTILPSTDITGAGNGYDTASDYYMWFNGTSCATPYAAGVAALIISKDPSLTPSQVRTALTTTCTDMTFDGGAGWDQFTGYGMVNANNALNSLIPGMPFCTITSPITGTLFNLNDVIPIEVTATDTDGTITQVAFYVDDVFQYTDNSAPWAWNWNTAGFSGGYRSVKAIATDNGSNTANHTISIMLLAPADDGFESGSFGAYPWVNTSSIPWTIQTSDVFSGTYAAKSGTITHSGTTDLSLTLNIVEPGNIIFFNKIGSEQGFDYMRFLIDTVQQDQWSGTVDWAMRSYAVTAGSHTFTWRYMKDTSVDSGSDCAYLDHIIFPPYSIPSSFYPPQNLSATAGNGFVNLSWQAPALGTPTGYKIYRNSALLTTVTGLSYTDNAVTNGTTYNYYLIAAYTGGNSDPTTTVSATPNVVTSVIIGTGTSSNATNAACPINVYYQSLHGQAVYLASELTAQGLTGSVTITQIGFNVTGLPSLAMPSFIVRMGHTSSTNVASWITAASMSTVYSATSYQPTTTGWNMITLSTPFVWNGTSNIVIDTAFGRIGSWNQSGTTQYSSVTDGYRYSWNDDADQTNVFTGGSSTTYRPNLKLAVLPAYTGPEIVVNQTSLAFGAVAVGSSTPRQFTIQNTGDQTLTGTITTPAGYSVEPSRSASVGGSVASKDFRNTVNINITQGASQAYDLTFTPTEAVQYDGNVVISTNAAINNLINLAVSGLGYIPPTISLDTNSISVNLMQGDTGTDSFTISNTGMLNLDYSISSIELTGSPIRQSDPAASNVSTRNISGSTLTLDVSAYTPGATQDWVFTAYNASTDSEWLEDIYITFPAGVTVNSASTFVGGSGGALTPDLTSGNGITINWYDAAGAIWGIIYGGESAVATVNVTIPAGMTAPISLAWQLNGDIYGTEPHVLTGTIDITADTPPIAWFSTDIESGTILPYESDVVTGNFSAVGMTPGTYNALLTIYSNDPIHPATEVNVQMVVSGVLETPVLTISQVAGGTQLDWDFIIGANEYWVYRSDDPYGVFELLDTTVINQYLDTESHGKVFYYVKAVILD